MELTINPNDPTVVPAVKCNSNNVRYYCGRQNKPGTQPK